MPAYLVDDENGIEPQWLQGKSRIGITAGASAPEILVGRVIKRLQELGANEVSPLRVLQEKVNFPLPKGL